METLTNTVGISDSVVHAMLGDETVLMDSDCGMYYGLNDVGSRIWELIVPGASKEDIVRALLLEYDVDPAQARADVKEFFQILASKHLTRVVSE